MLLLCDLQVIGPASKPVLWLLGKIASCDSNLALSVHCSSQVVKSWRAAASSGLTFTQLWDVIFHDDNLDATQSTELKGKIETIWNEMDTCLHANAPYVSTMIFFMLCFNVSRKWQCA